MVNSFAEDRLDLWMLLIFNFFNIFLLQPYCFHIDIFSWSFYLWVENGII